MTGGRRVLSGGGRAFLNVGWHYDGAQTVPFHKSPRLREIAILVEDAATEREVSTEFRLVTLGVERRPRLF
jgi:hypothetical protein